MVLAGVDDGDGMTVSKGRFPDEWMPVEMISGARVTEEEIVALMPEFDRGLGGCIVEAVMEEPETKVVSEGVGALCLLCEL